MAIFGCVGLVTVNGCSSVKHTHGDPLIGEHKGNIAPVPPAPPAKTSSVDPPTMTPTGSNAALAVNTLPGGRPLAIQEASWQRNAQSPAPGPVGVPQVQAVPRVGQTPGNIQMAGWSPTGPTAESPEAMLQSRRVINPQQENVPNGVHVSGFVRDRTTPSRLHFVEATARDYNTAVQALVQQIDQLR